MAKTPPPTVQLKQSTTINKLSRLPKGTKISKRPLLHPAIAPPRTGASVPKIVYISSSSPFISSVKRVRKYLSEIDKRAMTSSGFEPSSNKHGDHRAAAAGKKLAGGGAAKRAGRKDGRNGEGEEVLIKATGKAIEKALRLALFFQGQEDCRVRLRTGSVGAVDDLSIVPDGERGEVVEKVDSEEGKAERDGDEDGDAHEEMAEVVPDETRIRRTSMLEVGVSLR